MGFSALEDSALAERLIAAVAQRDTSETKRLLEQIKTTDLANHKEATRRRVGALFLVADEQENGGASWWVVYMAGVKVFGSPDEAAADAFRSKLHDNTLRTLGLKP